jgi:hypothetical protein
MHWMFGWEGMVALLVVGVIVWIARIIRYLLTGDAREDN